MKIIENLFKGRINRRNLVLGLISSLSIYFIILGNLFYIVTSISNIFVFIFAGMLYAISLISVLTFNISLQVRRWHDLGLSGNYVFLNLILTVFVILYVCLKRGQQEDNKYGSKPSKKLNFLSVILGIDK
ncbi:MAG: DUF805 domain-containing protein [Candidatus Levyibacteriota bacterium]